KIYKIPAVDQATAKGIVMVQNTQLLDDIRPVAPYIDRCQRRKAGIEDKAEEQSDQEGNNLVLGNRRGKYAYGGKDCAQQKQSYIGTCHAGRIDIAYRIAQLVQAVIVKQGRQQGQQQQKKTAQVFPQ